MRLRESLDTRLRDPAQLVVGQAARSGNLALDDVWTLACGNQVVERAPIEAGVALITPTIRSDSAGLTVTLERDGFIPATPLAVSAPVPDLTMTCPTEVSVPSQGQHPGARTRRAGGEREGRGVL